MMDDRTGLLFTSYMLLIIAQEGDEEEMQKASQAVSGFAYEKGLADKYMTKVLKLMADDDKISGDLE